MAIPRPAKRKKNGGSSFYFSQGDSPSTVRGRRRHDLREKTRKHHAELVWTGRVFV